MAHHTTIGVRTRLACGSLLIALAVPAAAADALRAAPVAQAGPAARAQASLDEILKEIATYDGGIESAAYWKLRDYVQARKDDAAGRAECESKLLAFLATAATPAAKMAASRHLRVVAGEGAVPALQALLASDESADLALYVLQQLPGPAADSALVQALSMTKVSGSTKIAVIAALGERRSAGAVPALASLLAQPECSGASAIALGRIGGDAAAGALLAAYDSLPAPARRAADRHDSRDDATPGARPPASDAKAVVAAAIVECADRFLASGNHASALRLYDAASADTSVPVATRKAAAMGRIPAAGSRGATILMGYLEGSDVEMQEAAIARITRVITPDAIAPICAVLPRLPEVSQVKLIAVLAGYPADRVLPAIAQAARSTSATVRIAAIKALESKGDASLVPFLVQAAAAARGPEQAAVRSALATLKGRAVDEAIVALMAQQPSEDVQAELLRATADRRMFAAKSVVASLLASPSRRIRVQALKTLRPIGTPSDIPAVLDLLVACDDDTERAEAEGTVSALAMKVARPDDRAAMVKARLNTAKAPAVRARLLGILPLLGDSSTLPVVRASLRHADPQVRDAAVRALAAWPTTAARDDVLGLARDSRDETHRLLAIRGLIRLVTVERYREPKAAAADLWQVAAFSWRPDEQRLVLGALSQFPCADSLELATSFLSQESVKEEAQAAIDRIKPRLKSGT